jgi:hypothetical protein
MTKSIETDTLGGRVMYPFNIDPGVSLAAASIISIGAMALSDANDESVVASAASLGTISWAYTLTYIEPLHFILRDFGNFDPIVFDNYVLQWKKERSATSSITSMALSPAYQQIIGMGEPAIPLILSQLRLEGDQPDMWFWALQALTGADPVREEDRGDMVAMAKAWLEWGRANGVS